MFRGSGIFAVIMAVIAAVALADLVANPKGTQTLTKAGVQAETHALNAELGKTG